MEEHKTNQTTATNPSSVRYDSPPPDTAHGGDTPKEEDHINICEPKKRKGCPSDLDKCQALIKKKCSTLNSSYSFTFDTKLCGGSGFANTPESTPKFGSFNSVSSTVIDGKEKVVNEEGEDEEVKLERINGSVD